MNSRFVVRSSKSSEEGQDLAEYAILLGLLALTVVGALFLLGDRLKVVWDTLGSTLSGLID